VFPTGCAKPRTATIRLYWYDAELNRAVAVDPQIMFEGLRKVYKAAELLRELGTP
jgi:hypothetical protein